MEKIIEESIQGTALELADRQENARKLYIESYGCQMNFSDSEIVASILSEAGFNTTTELEEADLVLVNTCSIREKAETTVRNRLARFNAIKKSRPHMKVGVLGCMAERLKSQFLEEEKIVDMVVGPDAYKDLPNLIREVDDGRQAVNVILSKEETYKTELQWGNRLCFNYTGLRQYVHLLRGTFYPGTGAEPRPSIYCRRGQSARRKRI